MYLLLMTWWEVPCLKKGGGLLIFCMGRWC